MRPHRDLLFPFWLSLLKRGGPRGKGVLLAISQAPYRPVCVDAIVLRNRLGTHKDQFLILSVGELRTLGSHFLSGLTTDVDQLFLRKGSHPPAASSSLRLFLSFRRIAPPRVISPIFVSGRARKNRRSRATFSRGTATSSS